LKANLFIISLFAYNNMAISSKRIIMNVGIGKLKASL
jgi:hypothetical protein